ncbi:acyl-CoA carboxylase epsilon subunit [Streptomyces sp. NPDC090106]|uniref:acyl-CoA carboxylase epsilon subunit n=1 Tax=Streptomyces sp. NPDC090106 TaxID=3365946 RepID=UPI00381B8115
MDDGEVLLRVERGSADEVELAALAAVLFALCASAEEPDEELPEPGSRWWRKPPAYAAPESWR